MTALERAQSIIADKPRYGITEDKRHVAHDFASSWIAECQTAEKCNQVAEALNQKSLFIAWILQMGLSTGHGDSFEDLLAELEWQINELRPIAKGADNVLD